jgi:hypothetical protein
MTAEKLEQLYSKFKKLSEENQYFILGYSEGLKQAQNAFNKDLSKNNSAAVNEK